MRAAAVLVAVEDADAVVVVELRGVDVPAGDGDASKRQRQLGDAPATEYDRKEKPMLLHGRKAIITGASSGIGKATAERLAREGASVCVNYYSDKEADDAAAVVEHARAAGAPTAVAVQADVSEEEDVERLVAQASELLSGIDLLVNNAGIEKQVPLLEMPLDTWNAILKTNLTGAFLCLREAGKVMAEAEAAPS